MVLVPDSTQHEKQYMTRAGKTAYVPKYVWFKLKSFYWGSMTWAGWPSNMEPFGVLKLLVWAGKTDMGPRFNHDSIYIDAAIILKPTFFKTVQFN